MTRKQASWLLNGVMHGCHSTWKCELTVVDVPPIFTRKIPIPESVSDEVGDHELGKPNKL